jgi:hypothetical protein
MDYKDAERIARIEASKKLASQTGTTAPTADHAELREQVFKLTTFVQHEDEQPTPGGGLVDDVLLDNKTVVKDKIAYLTNKLIKQSYESNADTNCLTDALLNKLNTALTDATYNGTSVVTGTVAILDSIGSAACKVEDVQVDNVSVVKDKIANIDLASVKTEVNNYTDNSIKNAIAGISGVKFSVVDALPTTGEAGTIYCLVGTDGTLQEYIWYNDTFQKLNASVELTEITAAQIDEWWALY